MSSSRETTVGGLHDEFCKCRQLSTYPDIAYRHCPYRKLTESSFDAGIAEGRLLERRDVVAFLDAFDCPNCHPDGNYYPCSSDCHALAELDAIEAGAHVSEGVKVET